MNLDFDIKHLVEAETVTPEDVRVGPEACSSELIEQTPEDMLFSRLKLPVQNKARELEKLLLPILQAGKKGRGKRIAALAAQLGKSPVRVRALFDAYREGGRMALVDKKRAGVALRGSVPAALVQFVKALMEKEGANLRQAYGKVLTLWKLGKPIPGYSYPPPATITGLPAGWSINTFYRLCEVTTYDRTLVRIGRAAAKSFLPPLNTTRAKLRCGQIYMFDDVWHDIHTHELGINRAPVRPLELCCLDLFSASKVAYGLFPRRTDEDTGMRINLRDSHMRFLTAFVLTQIGFHPGGCRLIVEHGTAAVSTELEELLHRESGGLITISRGGIQDAPALLGAWGGPKRGNFRVKAALESIHRLPHFWAKSLPGQMGSNSRTDRPEELTGREAELKRLDTALVKAIAAGTSIEHIATFLEQLSAPFLPFAVYQRIIADIYRLIDNRKEHDLEGWETAELTTGEFRLKLESPEWLPDAMFDKLADPEIHGQLAALISANAGFHRNRKLSPAEVWQSERKYLKRLPPFTIPVLLGEENAREAVVQANGTFKIEDRAISLSPLIYIARARDLFGNEILLRHGQTYKVFCNPFDGERLFVCDAKLRPVGICSRHVSISDADMDAIRAAQVQQAREENVRLQPYQLRHAPDAAAAAATREQNNRAIAELLAKNPQLIAARKEHEAETAVAATDMDEALAMLRNKQ